MIKYRLIFLLIVLISIPVLLNTTTLHASENNDENQITLTQEQAAILASKLANDKFKKNFGLSPFKPGSYTAELIGNKWHWGEINPAGINGCCAAVTFDKDGSNENVKVAFYTDRLLDTDIQRQQNTIEKVIPKNILKEIE